MKIVIHASPNIEWQGRYAQHAQSGLVKHGHNVSIVAHPRPAHCHVAIIMGPNMYQAVERANQPYMMFNRKLIGNRPSTVHTNCALSWNGFNGDGIFCVILCGYFFLFSCLFEYVLEFCDKLLFVFF